MYLSILLVAIFIAPIQSSSYPDEVKSLPTYGDLPADSQYSGFVTGTKEGNNKIH